jgi:hypothetical protein
MSIPDVTDRLSQFTCVTDTNPWLEKSILDYNIGDPDSFPLNRVSSSRLVFDEDTDKYVVKGTIRVKHPEKSSHTGSGDKLAETLTEGVKIAIIDSVVHIYLTKDTIHRPKDVFRIMTIIEENPETFFEELRSEWEP